MEIENEDDAIFSDKEGSEAGDDIHCTQLMVHDQDDPISSDDDDEEAGLALSELLSRSKSRLSLTMKPVDDQTPTDHLPNGNDQPDVYSKIHTSKFVPRDKPDREIVELDHDKETDKGLKYFPPFDSSYTATNHDFANGDRSNVIIELDTDENERLHSGAPGEPCTGTSPSPERTIVLKGEPLVSKAMGNQGENAKLEVCPTCGSSLVHIRTWKGRVNHVKRCSKQNGISANDIKARLEEEEDDCIQDENDSNSTSVSHAKRLSQVNPYQQKPISINSNATQRTVTQSQKSFVEKDKSTSCAPSVMDMLMAGARKVAQLASRKRKLPEPETQQQTAGTGRRRFQSNTNYNSEGYSARRRTSCPAYKKITGTDFVVDGFHYANPALTQNYFLTHFHSDHYGGITRHWDSGTIYCSNPTANLVHSQLGVEWKYLHALPMNRSVSINTFRGISVTVTLVDANHCPGAVMMLFEVGGRSILHVGDFRWNSDVMLKPLESPLRSFCGAMGGTGRLDELFLDTTYCNPKYALPSQQEAIEAAVEYAERQVREARSMKQDILLLFGAYTIGKERIYLAVAERLKMKVYVDRRRYRIVSQFGWPQEQMALYTTNPKESILWVVPLGHVSMKKLPSYTSVQIGKSFSRDFDRVIGFRPTGWSMTSKPKKYKDGSTSSLIRATSRGKISSCGVPYSEHSSFPELVACLKALNPRKIVPTVSVSKSKEQIDLLLSHMTM